MVKIAFLNINQYFIKIVREDKKIQKGASHYRVCLLNHNYLASYAAFDDLS